MGFKANARKRRQAAATASGPAEKADEEYVGEKKCDVADCGNWADKKVGGRRLAFDRAVDVWVNQAYPLKPRESQCASHATDLGRKRRRMSPPSGLDSVLAIIKSDLSNPKPWQTIPTTNRF